MHLPATGTETRPALVLILHDASKHPTAPAPHWTPKGALQELGRLYRKARRTASQSLRDRWRCIPRRGFNMVLATNFGEPYACGMKRVAVFGNAGGGKSTLAKRLAQITGLPLNSVDTIKYKVGGGDVPREQYFNAHADLLLQDEWIIDGFGCVPSAWERFSRADTLVYIDLPVMTHYYWVTKRLIKGLFINPQGWPEKSPMWRSTMSSYRVIPTLRQAAYA